MDISNFKSTADFIRYFRSVQDARYAYKAELVVDSYGEASARIKMSGDSQVAHSILVRIGDPYPYMMYYGSMKAFFEGCEECIACAEHEAEAEEDLLF